ncbi:uncharacterized protein LOC144435169 isoform X2 [Glandiceps talaboti]
MSKDVIKSTARKLKYYMEIKRLEDGFDLSGPELPRQRYPTKKPRPTLQYDGLHDRSLKHYFHDDEVKVHLNTLNARHHQSEKEQKVKKDVTRYMASSRYTHPYLPDGVLYVPVKPPKPKKGTRSYTGTRPYSAGSRPYSAGATRRKKQGTLRGGSVALRSRPPGYISQGEAERIINTATKLLVATENVGQARSRSRGRKPMPAGHGKPYDKYYGIQNDDDNESLPYIDHHGSTEDGNRRYGYASDTTSRDSSQIVSRRRPRTATGGYTRRPDRPMSAKGQRPRPVRPSSAKFAYDMNGRKYRIERIDEPAPRYKYDASASEDDDVSERVDGRYNGSKVSVSARRSRKDLPAWLAAQRAAADDDEEENDRGHDKRKKKSKRKERKMRDEDFVQADMATQTAVTNSTQTICYDEAKSVQTVTDKSTGLELKDNCAQATVSITQTSAQTTEVPGVSTQADLPSPPYDPDAHLDNLKHGPRLKSGRRIIYEITVVTGNRLGASTKADVHVTIYGSKGNTGKIKLKQARAGGKLKFQKAQTDVFKVDTFHVGKLECIEIGHDRKELGMGWFLEKVIVREDEEKATYEFHCSRWLSAMDDDSRTVRILPLSDITYMSSSESETETETQTEAESTVVSKSEPSTHYSQPSDTDGNVSETTVTTATQAQSSSSSDSDSDDSASVKIVRVRRKDAPPSTTATSASSSSESESSDSESETQTETQTETEPEDTRNKPKSKKLSGNEQAPSREGVDKSLGVHKEQEVEDAKQMNEVDSDTSSKRRSSLEQKQPSLPTIKEKDRDSRTSLSSASSSSSSSSSSSASESETESEQVRKSTAVSETESEIQKKVTSVTESGTEDRGRSGSSSSSSGSDSSGSSSSSESDSDNEHKSKSTMKSDSEMEQKTKPSESESEPVKEERKEGGSDSESHTDSDSDSDTTSGSISDTSSGSYSDSETDTNDEDSKIKHDGTTADDIPPRPASPTPPPSTSSVTPTETQDNKADIFMEGFKAGMKASEESEKGSSVKTLSDNEEDRIFRQGPSIHDATKNGNLDRVKALVTRNKQLVNELDERGRAPLHTAAEHNQLDILKWLAVNGADIKQETRTGYTAMHMAALNGHVRCMNALSVMGASVSTKTIDSQTPLHLAAMSGHLESCKWLVANRASLDGEDMNGRTPLDLAEQYDHPDVVKLLKSCQQDLRREDSGISQLRSPRRPEANEETKTPFTDLMNTKQTTTSDSATSWTDDKDQEERGKERRARRSSSSSSGSSSTGSSSSGSGSESDSDSSTGSRNLSRGASASGSQTDSRNASGGSRTVTGSSSGTDSGSVTKSESEADLKKELPEKMKKEEEQALKAK